MKKLLLLLALPLLMMAAVSCDGVLPIPGGPGGPDDPDNPGVVDPSLDEIIEFKDPNFLKALLTVQKIYFSELWTGDDDYTVDVDTNKDGKISVGEAKKVKALMLTRGGELEFHIKEMPEIKYFTSLEYLDFTQSTLTSLDVSENKNLKVLVSWGSELLSSINVSGCANLQTLYMDGSMITEIDLNACLELRRLYLGDYYDSNPEYGRINSIDISNNTKLTDLKLSCQMVTELDVSNNKELVYLYCSGCEIGMLDLSNNHNLMELFCSGNKLTELDLSANTELTELSCDDNMLSALDLSKNPYLECLNCENNQITELDLRNNKQLHTLQCGGNNLERVILPWATKLDSYFIKDILSIVEFVGAPVFQLEKIELSEHESYTTVSCRIKAEAAAGIRTRLLTEDSYNEEIARGRNDYDIITSYESTDESQDVIDMAAAGGYDWSMPNCQNGTKYIFLVMATYPNGLYQISKTELQTANLFENESWELVSDRALLECGMFPGLSSEMRLEGVRVYKHNDADIFKMMDPFYNVDKKFPALQNIFEYNGWYTERWLDESEYYTIIDARNPEKVSVELNRPTTVVKKVSVPEYGGPFCSMWLYSKAHDDSNYSFGKYDKEKGIIELGHIVWECIDAKYDTGMTSSLILDPKDPAGTEDFGKADGKYEW